MEKFKRYLKLFLTAFRLSAFTFGGGYVIVPLMRKQFVDKLHWIDENEMMDMVAIAQSAPGSLAVNAIILVGYKVNGAVGALVGTLGTVLPPLILLSFISHYYAFFKTNPYVNAALSAMSAAVAAVVFDVVIKMLMGIKQKQDKSAYGVILVAFLLTYILKINVVFIILLAGLYGVLQARWRTSK